MTGSNNMGLLLGATILLIIGIVNGQNQLHEEACQALCGSRYNPFDSEWDLSGRARNWGRWKVNSGSKTKYSGTNPWWFKNKAAENGCYGTYCPENHKKVPPKRDEKGFWLQGGNWWGW